MRLRYANTHLHGLTTSISIMNNRTIRFLTVLVMTVLHSKTLAADCGTHIDNNFIFSGNNLFLIDSHLPKFMWRINGLYGSSEVTQRIFSVVNSPLDVNSQFYSHGWVDQRDFSICGNIFSSVFFRDKIINRIELHDGDKEGRLYIRKNGAGHSYHELYKGDFVYTWDILNRILLGDRNITRKPSCSTFDFDSFLRYFMMTKVWFSFHGPLPPINRVYWYSSWWSEQCVSIKNKTSAEYTDVEIGYRGKQILDYTIKNGQLKKEKMLMPGGYITHMEYTDQGMPLEYSRYKLINDQEVRDGLYLRWVPNADTLETQRFYINGEEHIPAPIN